MEKKCRRRKTEFGRKDPRNPETRFSCFLLFECVVRYGWWMVVDGQDL